MRRITKKSREISLLIAIAIISLIQPLFIISKPESIPTKQEAKLKKYIEESAKKTDPRINQAIGNINGTARQLLALRGYLRSESSIKTKWSWTNDEIAQYKQSAEYAAALAEVKEVTSKFEEANPGYTIYVNTDVRSLNAQINNWNETNSVITAADDLLKVAQQEISKQIYPDNLTQQSLSAFEQFLKNQNLSTTPTVATPGFSQHGQLRAFDFQVKKGNQIVAGTESSQIETIWDAQGWTQKLKTAVTSASKKFTGPLSSPREPWHYTYTP